MLPPKSSKPREGLLQEASGIIHRGGAEHSVEKWLGCGSDLDQLRVGRAPQAPLALAGQDHIDRTSQRPPHLQGP